MKTPAIWRKLLVEGRKMVTSEEIRELALRIEKAGARSISYLQEHGYITRVLRGIHYVKNADERERNYHEWSVYEMVAWALKMKGVEHWYFGLETALKLNGMTHEYFAVDCVITNRIWASRAVNILESKFHIYKWSQRHFEFGMKRKGSLVWSDKEKTVLDMAYKRYRDGQGLDIASAIIKEYSSTLNTGIIRRYLERYPKRFGNAIGGIL